MHKIVFNILQRVLVNHFYKVNAGFFLFFFFLLFGTVNGSQLVAFHLSLIHGMIRSIEFLGCVIVIWTLYTLKCINYTTQVLNNPRQQFLSILNRLSGRSQYFYLLFVHVMVYMPVLVYSVLVAVIALKEGYIGSMIAVIVVNVLLALLSASVYKKHLQRRTRAVSLQLFAFTLPKPLFSIALWFVWKERGQMLFVTKTFTLLLLYGFIQLYEPDGPDVRPILLIMTLVVVSHAAIIAQIRQFEEERMLFTRNLPVPFAKRLAMLWLQYTLLLLPEFVFMWIGFPLHFQWVDVPQIVLLSMGVACLLHVFLVMSDISMETYYKTVFAAWAGLFFVLLYDPGILLALLVIMVSAAVFHSHLYDFERKQ